MSKVYVNQRDKRGAGVQGHNAEQLFVDQFKKRGYKVIKSSIGSDIHDHIDFTVSKKGKSFTVDVKSEKDENKVYIEFKNVRGNDGWLYGKQDYIAFVFKKEIILVKRSKLQEMMEESMDLSVKPMKASIEQYYYVYEDEALYVLLQRYGREDSVALIPRNRLYDIEKSYTFEM